MSTQNTLAQYNTQLKLGVIIVTYNRLELLKKCLESCINQTVNFSKVIVVDNASTDGTTDFLRANAQITTLTLQNNIGGSGGFCEGIKFAMEQTDLDYFLLIDDDVILDSKYNEYILPHIIKHKLAATSGTVITDGEIQLSHRKFIKNNGKKINSQYDNYKKVYFDYDLASFCGLYVSKELVKNIGLPRADFFIWHDDEEYSLRIKQYTKIRNINKAFLTHKTLLQQQKEDHWKTYYGVRNQYIIIQQYFSRQLPKFVLKKILQIIYYTAKLTPKNRTIAKMYKDALFDAKHNRLGKNEKYNSNFTID